MKKWICAALVAALLLLGTGCSLSDSVRNYASRYIEERSSASAAAVPEESENGGDAVEGEVLAETDDFVLSVLSGRMEDGAFILTVRVENKTDDTVMQISMEDAYVNSLLWWPSWYAEPEAGETEVCEAVFYGLDEAGIKDATQLDFTLQVSDSENWERDMLYSESITYYPKGEAAATRHEPPQGSRETVLADNEDFKMTVVDFDPLDDYAYSVAPYVENRSDRKLLFMIESVKIDGKPAEPYWSVALMPQKAAAEEIYWPWSTLSEIGIKHAEDITEIKFQLTVYDDENANEVVFRDNFTFRP